MTFDEFLARVRTESDRTFECDVRVSAPAVLEAAKARSGMRMTDYLAAPHVVERRTVRRGHVLGPGVSPATLTAWRARWPRHPLPDHLAELLGKADGIHLWADLDTGRAYHGLAPLEEWDLARRKLWEASTDDTLLSDRYLALSYHADGAAFVVLNVDSGTYFLVDTAGADESCPIGERAISSTGSGRTASSRGRRVVLPLAAAEAWHSRDCPRALTPSRPAPRRPPR